MLVTPHEIYLKESSDTSVSMLFSTDCLEGCLTRYCSIIPVMGKDVLKICRSSAIFNENPIEA